MTTPRASTTVCLMRDGADGPEVLLVQRDAGARFMPGAWVFPGGAVDDADAAAADVVHGVMGAELRWVAAGVREVVEEVGIWLTREPFARASDNVFVEARSGSITFAGQSLTLFSNWITPAALPVRFDTRFYLGVVDSGIEPIPDRREIDAAMWIRPRDVGDAVLDVPFPTLRNLALLDGYGSAVACFDHFAAIDHIPVVEPRMRIGARGRLEVLLPGDPGFEEVDVDLRLDREALRAAAEARGVTEADA